MCKLHASCLLCDALSKGCSASALFLSLPLDSHQLGIFRENGQ